MIVNGVCPVGMRVTGLVRARPGNGKCPDRSGNLGKPVAPPDCRNARGLGASMSHVSTSFLRFALSESRRTKCARRVRAMDGLHPPFPLIRLVARWMHRYRRPAAPCTRAARDGVSRCPSFITEIQRAVSTSESTLQEDGCGPWCLGFARTSVAWSQTGPVSIRPVSDR